MSSLTVRDKFILLVLASVAVLIAGYRFIITPAWGKIDSLSERVIEYKMLMVDKVPAVERLQTKEVENNTLLEQMRNMGGETRMPAQQEFLVFLSNSCSRNNVSLIRFSDLGGEPHKNVIKKDYDFELRGDIADINAVCAAIDDMDVRYSVGSMSLRQDMNYPYLERTFDKLTSLEWYEKEAVEGSGTMRLSLTLELVGYESL